VLALRCPVISLVGLDANSAIAKERSPILTLPGEFKSKEEEFMLCIVSVEFRISEDKSTRLHERLERL